MARHHPEPLTLPSTEEEEQLFEKFHLLYFFDLTKFGIHETQKLPEAPCKAITRSYCRVVFFFFFFWFVSALAMARRPTPLPLPSTEDKALNCFLGLVAMARRPTPLTLPSTDEEDVIFQQEASWNFLSFTLFL